MDDLKEMNSAPPHALPLGYFVAPVEPAKRWLLASLHPCPGVGLGLSGLALGLMFGILGDPAAMTEGYRLPAITCGVLGLALGAIGLARFPGGKGSLGNKIAGVLAIGVGIVAAVILGAGMTC